MYIELKGYEDCDCKRLIERFVDLDSFYTAYRYPTSKATIFQFINYYRKEVDSYRFWWPTAEEAEKYYRDFIKKFNQYRGYKDEN